MEYPDLIPLLRYIKNSGRYSYVITNGAKLAKHGAALLEAGLDAVSISLDAQEKTHDRLRGAPGTFQAAIRGIRTLQAESAAQRRRRPLIAVNAVLLPSTAGELPGLIQQLKAEGVDHVNVSKQTCLTEHQGKSYEKVFERLFQIKPQSWKGFVRDSEPEPLETLKAVVEEISRDPAYRGFVKWSTSPSWSAQDLLKYYGDPTWAAPSDRRCRFPWDAVNILPNGDLSPCPDFPDVVVGNVKESSFTDIWNGPRFVDFRKKLGEEGRFPICASCCHLYDE